MATRLLPGLYELVLSVEPRAALDALASNLLAEEGELDPDGATWRGRAASSSSCAAPAGTSAEPRERAPDAHRLEAGQADAGGLVREGEGGGGVRLVVTEKLCQPPW